MKTATETDLHGIKTVRFLGQGEELAVVPNCTMKHAMHTAAGLARRHELQVCFLWGTLRVCVQQT